MPKRYRAESLMTAMEQVGEEAKIEPRGPRIPAAVCNARKGCGCRCRPCDVITLSRLWRSGWIPWAVTPTVREGLAAKGRPTELRFFQRPAMRRPIIEIAGFIAPSWPDTSETPPATRRPAALPSRIASRTAGCAQCRVQGRSTEAPGCSEGLRQKKKKEKREKNGKQS